jgi:anti-anti-sigma factor
MSWCPILEVQVEAHERERVIRARGEIDMSSVEMLRGPLDSARSDSVDTVVDLSGIAFMDSSGLQLMLDATREADTNGWTVSFRPSPPVRRLLEVSGTLDAVPLG